MQELMKDFPFRCTLSLRPIIEFWLSPMGQQRSPQSCLAVGLAEQIAKIPELKEPIEDLGLLERYEPIVQGLLAAVFPPALWDVKPMAGVIPFCMKPVVASPMFRRLFLREDGSFAGEILVGQESFFKGRVARAYLRILREFYGIEESLDFPVLCKISDPDTGLERFFRLQLNPRFVEMRLRGELPVLSEEEKLEMLENLNNPEVLTRILPPENFEVEGLTLVEAVDVTQSEVISALERDLIDQESVFTRSGFSRLQERLRTLFRRPHLFVGFAVPHEDSVFVINPNGVRGDSTPSSHAEILLPRSLLKGSYCELAMEQGRIIRIPDIEKERQHSELDELLIKEGVRSLLVAPLSYRGAIIGSMHLACPRPGDLGPVDVLLLEQILPLFSMAAKRGLDEIEHSVQGIIKEKCTAVHPVVEWRFRRAAIRYMESLRKGEPAELEPIVFRDVYPIYGACDVRGSSEERSKALKEDIEQHLRLALDVVRSANRFRAQAILEELEFRLCRALERLSMGLTSGEEVTLAASIRKEVEPLFPYLEGMGQGVAEAIRRYWTAMDPHLGTVYKRRKALEESMSILTHRLSSYLEREEHQAQGLIPHYFEKHRTDGVDYIIYAGQSLLENGSFTDLHLESLRLWQIMLACGMAWLSEASKKELPSPLETTHLILLHRLPMAIRFRFDEKRFDVDGTYDIRHEILRARIDKALVKGTGERLTQPGRISMVYTHQEEAREAKRHIEFLSSKGFLRGDLENLDLEDLPGIQGLRALRIEVSLDSPSLREHVERVLG